MIRLRTLLNLLAYAAGLLGVAPLYSGLDRPVQAFWPAALLFGMLCDRREHYPLRQLPAAVLSCLMFTVYALNISRQQPVQPVVHILVLLLAMRLVTEKTGRNYLQIFVLAVFALAASTLLSLSAGFLVYLILLVLCVTVGLVLLTFHVADPTLRLGRGELRRIFSTALLLPLASLILMFGFFLILPRTSHPLWNFFNPPATATAAFAERVQPGAFAGLAATRAVAFRAEGEELPAEELYWRGTVLNAMEGTAWVRRPPPPETVRISGGRRIRQTLYPEPGTQRFLFSLDPPLALEGTRADKASDLVYTSRRDRRQLFRYDSLSAIGSSLDVVGGTDRAFYLQVPAAVSPRLLAVARRIAAEGNTDGQRIALLENFFLAQQLSYATTELPGPQAPVEEFLFENKRGYCEFFASSFALLLRLSGVPSRLVGGYHGGDYNALGGYYLVSEDAAHVWVEALVDGRSWVRIDPSRLAQNAGSVSRQGPGPGQRLLDALDYYWTRMVITYDLGRQVQVLQQLGGQVHGFHLPRPAADGWLLLPAAAGLAFSALLLLRRRRVEERLLTLFLHRLRKKHRLGSIPASLGLLELAERLGDPLCRKFAEVYGGAVFRDRRLTRRERQLLRQLLRQLRRS